MGQTETKVAQVTLKSQMDRSKTVNIDRPKDDLTLNQIKTAFAPAIQGGWLLDNYGDTIVSVAEAKYNQVIKTSINGEPVVVSPSTFDLEVSSAGMIGASVTQDLTITGGAVISTNIEQSNTSQLLLSATILNDGAKITVTATKKNQTVTAASGLTLRLYFEGSTTPVTVPFNVTVS